LWLILFLVTTIPLTASSAQTKPGGIIAGKVFDRETGNPLENAIVFLANTPIGTSSASDGTFIIASVPVGVFQMVIARVGYERELVDLNVTKPESLYFEIKLQPKPVRTKEVEVVGKRPGGMEPEQYTFFPKESPNTHCIYGAGSSMPIGIFFSDSAFYMYALDTAIVDSEKYIRCWLLYQNLTQTPFDFDPMKCIRLHMHGRRGSYDSLLPSQPSNINSEVAAHQAQVTVQSTFGQSLRSLAVVREKYNTWDYRWYLAKHPSMDNPTPFLNVPPSNDQSLSSTLYRIFRKSMNAGIIQPNRVYPSNAINGYIYFAFPGLNWKVTKSGFPEAIEYSYTLEIVTQCGSKFIEFVPH
jgi:hypothetical protein